MHRTREYYAKLETKYASQKSRADILILLTEMKSDIAELYKQIEQLKGAE